MFLLILRDPRVFGIRSGQSLIEWFLTDIAGFERVVPTVFLVVIIEGFPRGL